MLGLLFFLLALYFGFTLVRLLPITFYKVESVAVAVVLGLFFSSWVALFFALFLPMTVAIGLTMVGVAAASFFIGRQRTWLVSQQVEDSLDIPESNYGWALFTLLTTLILAWMFYTHMLRVDPDGWSSMGGSWGDLALHSALINYFATQGHFSFVFPVFVHTRLTYPFIIDFLSAILVKGGWSLQAALLVPGLALVLSLVQLVFFVSYRMFKRVGAGLIAAYLFLFNGSVMGSWYAYQDWRASHLPLGQFLSHLPLEYTHLADHNLHFTNTITAFLLPQRTILFGLSIFCILLILAMALWQRPGKGSLPLLISMGLLIGLLPWTHTHTFIVCVVVFGILLLVRGTALKIPSRYWWVGIGLAVLLAGPQLAWQFLGSYHTDFSHFYFGWMRGAGQSFPAFWTSNTGIEWLFILTMPFLLRFYKAPKWQVTFAWSLLVLFALLNLYIFQPNNYDNTKILIYVHLGTAWFMGYLFTEWVRKWRWTIPVVVIILLSLTASGLLAVLQEGTNKYDFLSNSEVDFARAFVTVVPPKAVVLTGNQHNHPVPVLTGREIVMGYPGWLWSYGFDYVPVERDVVSMYEGGYSTERLLLKYNVDYVVIGPDEWQINGINEAYFADRYPLVLSADNWHVYKVK